MIRRRSRATQQKPSGQETLQAANAALRDNTQQQQRQRLQQQEQQEHRLRQQQQHRRQQQQQQGAWEHLPTQAQLLAACRHDLLYSLRQYSYEDVLQELVAQGWHLSSRYKQPKQKVSCGLTHAAYKPDWACTNQGLGRFL